MPEAYYYNCRQILEEVLSPHGFSEGEEQAGLGTSTDFVRETVTFRWLYDLRDQLLLLSMLEGRKTLQKEYFHSAGQLQSGFLPALEKMLVQLGLDIPESSRSTAKEDLARF